MVPDYGISLVTEAIRGSRKIFDSVTEINKFNNLLGYYQRLQEGWRLRGEGMPLSNALHYDPEAQAKLDADSDVFDDVEFVAIARVVSIEDAPMGELSEALDQALNSPVRDPPSGAANAGKKAIE
jgi:hypothetical protein